MEGKTIAKIFIFINALIIVKCQVHDVDAAKEAMECMKRDTVMMDKLKVCYQEKVQSLGPLPQTEQTDMNSSIKIACSLTDPTSCLKDHVLHNSACLTDEQVELMKKSLDVFSAGYHYGCDNDGAKIKEFMDTGGMDCIKTMPAKTQEITDCVKKFGANIEQEVQAAGDDEEKKEMIGCNYLMKVKDCVFDNLECKKEPLEIVDGLIQTMLRETSCWKHISASSGNTLKRQLWYLMVLMSVVAVSY